MEKSSGEKAIERPFFCHLCSVSCASALNLQSHFLGIRHRRVEEALRKQKSDKDEPIERKPKPTLQEQIDECKNSEPAVGLEYIYQYKNHGYSTYECKLCECRSGVTHMFMHIVGAKHRAYYLNKHHPKYGITIAYVMTGPKKLKKLRDICATIEKEFGRQKINVIDLVENPWSLNTDITGASNMYYTPEQEQMDFTSDDLFGTEDKPASEHVTFLELKVASEADKKKAASSGNHIADNKEESEEPCESDKDFKDNKDLLEFLEHFRISEDGDAKFVTTVIELMSVALLRHKKASKEIEENKLSVSKSDASCEVDKCKEQDPAPSIVPPNAIQALQNEVSSAPEVNRGAPFLQSKFAPYHAQFPPRATPPLFPIAKDEIVNKFFESIKNMEVPEVISTLNKITATNPAFKGIHVPSLIRYLTETGKLKSTQSMQQSNQ